MRVTSSNSSAGFKPASALAHGGIHQGGRSAPIDMRLRLGRSALAGCRLDARGPCANKRSRSLERLEFESPTPDSNSTCRARRGHPADLVICSESRVWGTRSARSRIPRRTPKKLWLQVDVLGRTWSIGRRESSLEDRIFGRLLDVYGHYWTSTDVLGWLPGPDSKLHACMIRKDRCFADARGTPMHTPTAVHSCEPG